MNWDFAPMPKLGDDYTQYAQGSASPGWAIYAKLDGDKLKAAEKFLTFLQASGRCRSITTPATLSLSTGSTLR